MGSATDASDDDLDLTEVLQVRVSKAAKERLASLGKSAGLKPSPYARVLLYKVLGIGPKKGKR